MSFLRSCQSSLIFRLLSRSTTLQWAFFMAILVATGSPSLAQPAPPEPSETSAIGDTVTNPVTGLTTTVSGLRVDPAGTPTAGNVAFVQTADGFSFLVKDVGEQIYNDDPTPLGFTITSLDAASQTVQLDADPLDGNTAPLATQLLTSDLNAQLFDSGTPGVETPPVVVEGADGVRVVRTGRGGSNGRNGALFVPPRNGGDGANGPTTTFTNSTNVLTNNQIGLEVGSQGGKGGEGGDSFASFFDGRDGGDGGAGGAATAINTANTQIAATGDEKHGIFTFSRSGQAGDGGSGFAAPGGGTGGHSSDGGTSTTVNQGNVSTTGDGAYGIYGLSVSNNGGNGGGQWGFVGRSGDGGFGGNGDRVRVTNDTTGTVTTSGEYSHGILAQSIGGSGGSAGPSGNFILALQGDGDNGGDGGEVEVVNDGLITTSGDDARGIVAQSIGGGGGSGGSAGGLIAVGGSGSNGGSGGEVTVTNDENGRIVTTGQRADGILAQSVGGSGGNGSNAGGLVAVGGSGSRAGDGSPVTVSNLGRISTAEEGARGIVAQSIGGGGGDGGNSGGVVSVGGSGAGGGAGDRVSVTQGGEITTQGADATGVFAQSIGGGGGNGGSSGSIGVFAGVAVGGDGSTGGDGDRVDITLQGQDANTASVIRTEGDRAKGISAQSVGGGGGNGGGAVQVTGGFGGAASFAVGGQGGAGGAGGTVNVSQGPGLSIIETAGDDAPGALLQSVGGGGGNGGFAVSVAVSGGPIAGSLSTAIGGDGGTAGDGGTVQVGSFDGAGNLNSTGFNGSILTQGERSPGFFAQSVGGGGGNGGLAVSAAGSGSLLVSGSIGIGIGGDGAGGGDGGTVAVGTEGNITTEAAQSTGLLAQSVGGGGGNGGGTVAASLSGAGVAAGAIQVGIGGDAAGGGEGGEVTVATRSGQVTTGGEDSPGIVVQSVGGGGGNGGYSVTAGGSGAGVAAGTVNLGLGGTGGGGGQGGQVRADLQSDVTTTNQNSDGILVQSVGGGGGNGGFSVAVAGAGAGVGSGAVNVGLGGDGGTASEGGTVNASSTGEINTSGDSSTGFTAQSIGGGGGNGGFSVAVSGSGAGVGSGAINVGLGGDGSAGGDGGTVTASTSGEGVTTQGKDSIGILAQSVGGGGGNGGFNVGVAGSGAGAGSGAINVGLGGDGATGGSGQAVALTVGNDVTTAEQNAHGVVAQSLGGGGGNGGFNVSATGSGAGAGSGAISVGLGGDGAGGGDGGQVDSNVTGNINTAGENAFGVLAQSLGGGGGNGGFNVSGAGSGAGVGSGGLSVGLGGDGSTGGDGDRVTATFQGNISTQGKESKGFAAQSIGGGGGNGGFNVSATGSGAGTGSGAISVGLGGTGDGGGDGQQVNASVEGAITTTGDNAAAFTAQSLGGGGGSGGFNVNVTGSGAGTGSGAIGVGLGGSGGGGGNGGAVVAQTEAVISTLGEASAGILAQSVGGGGGDGGFNVDVTVSGAGTGSGAVGVGLGGSGAGGGDGSTVDLTVTNNVTTAGNDAGAVTAQSIGGGGGNGGFNVNVAGSAGGTGSAAVGVGLGGSGGGGGNSADVTNEMTGDIATQGTNSTGLLVQSVGGGGGNGGFNVSATASVGGTGSAAATVGLGGSGGAGGNSGAVESSLTGDVTTVGDSATGVTAQSIGGGGGNGGFNVSATISAAKTGSAAASVGIGGSGGGGGLSSTVDNTVIGDVTTTGVSSGGVLAQSLGGGGGNGGFNVSGAISGAQTGSGAVSVGVGGSGGDGGDGAAVTNAVTGDVSTSNTDAFGILAQSVGGGGGNGGINVSGSISAAKSTAGAIAIGIGGSGGSGGDGADVENTVNGFVQTTGDQSAGITTQSLGGGGGNGGLNVSGTISAAKTASGSLAVGVGGSGGDGGDAASATSRVTGGVITTGDDSTAILTQSLGGGGGNGAVNVTGAVNLSKDNGGSLGVGVGGFGGDGGNAGAVSSTVTVTTEQIATAGENATGISAQSIGGGGGNGGVNVTGSVNLTGKSGAAIAVGVGGFGGGAGNSSSVTLNATGDVVTTGDNANGVMAQSLGGGGGNGGTNVSGSLAITKPSSGDATTVAASIGVGGFGGGGGDAGDVDVDYSGTIQASPRVLVTPASIDPITGEAIPAVFANEDQGSHGLVAQSLGGGGGNGAVNVSAGLSYAAGDGDGHALLIGVGGFGGVGGNAGNVEVDVTGNNSITASGNGRSGILGSSIGGGGGNGGVNVSGGIVSDSPLIVGVGGFGGNGGTGGDVTVNAATDLFVDSLATDATNSAGLMAQSIGGGGGDGGLNVSGGLSLSKEDSVPSITFGIGGFGGAGAISGDVDATHAGIIRTSGGWTHGVFAQSIAGGGGNGALNVSGQVNFADSENSGGKTDLSIVAGLGGHGGAGADAGNTSVTSNGVITTSGDFARGIFAQSIGGGGGTGGANVTGVFAQDSSPISLGVGGFGSGGGDAGTVSVSRGSASEAAGAITTDGQGAIAIEASSIGGGGGDAGVNLVAGMSRAGSDSGNGGNNNAGNNNPRPRPQHDGVDDEVFNNFDAVLDQLEGKSPADAQDSQDANKSSAFAAQVAIGGAGGAGGDGAATTVENFSDLETRQDDSHGILAQSIGGGGGNAALNVSLNYAEEGDNNKGFNLSVGGAPGDAGDGSTVEVSHTGNIATQGNDSHGAIAQSIGGGGGNVGLDMVTSEVSGAKVGISIGRVGGTGGAGGDVSLSSNGIVSTQGNTAYGLFAQSVGNGGGNSSSTSVSLATPEDEDNDTPSRAASISVGLEGGEGGSAGAVDLEAAGVVSTTGENSHGLFAQSVGGGGGNAGSASGPDMASSTVGLSIGGTGGEGGTGGNINVTSSAQVSTQNRNSIGLLAQSVGGAGGTGGSVESGGVQGDGSSALINIGGSGGTGMASGQVAVENSGVILTSGDDSHGLLAQSIGGGGGNAGMVVTEIENEDATNATQLAISVGGDGGDGAVAGDVSVTNTGRIATSQVNSIGLFAQSIGGGGGNADQVVTESVSDKGAGNQINLGVGGSGGTGGTGGDVSISNQRAADGSGGEIVTLSDRAHGILAMSIGGGGGNGSSTTTTNKADDVPNNASTASFALSIGGSGGSGGTGGEVTVDNGGSISTSGDEAHGIIAQSIGGGGGNGGTSIAGDLAVGARASQNANDRTSSIALGGIGGDGNTGGNVTVNNSGDIEVEGDRAYGIYAQSVGGGGGNGAVATNLSNDLRTNPQTDLQTSLLNLGIGGNGGDGGDSGDVLVNHSGNITATGDDAYGIYAQSVSGGGGAVGLSHTSPTWMAADQVVSALIGGRNGAAGQAGTVTVNTTGNITTTGANSEAQFTQSVNGGGGDLELFLDVSETAVALASDDADDADSADGDDGGIAEQVVAVVTSTLGLGSESTDDAEGSVVEATHIGDLRTQGEASIASLTQSIGGGGGNADSTMVVDEQAQVALSLLLGAKNTNNSSGGDITSNRTGDVVTTGEQAQGVSVQSIGGGGGRLRTNVKTVSAVDTAQAVASQATASIVLGADPSFNNNGGELNLTFEGDTRTSGTYAPGLVLQSIGAGGGESYLTGFANATVELGASDDSTGNGGDINVANTGAIATAGELSHGIILQSIGGGGGLVITDLQPSDITLVESPDNGGDGGDINFQQVGDVSVTGDRAFGIVAQSLGGGGGLVDDFFAKPAGGVGASGNININLDGNLTAEGNGSVGLLGQSSGSSGTGNIAMVLTDDKTIKVNDSGTGVQFSGGASNSFINQGGSIIAASTPGTPNGYAFRGDSGNETITNQATGIIAGQVNLGAGINNLNNDLGGTLFSGREMFIGDNSDSSLTNRGLMLPGNNNVYTTAITGNYIQTESGVLAANVDFANDTIDRLNISQDASLEGQLNVELQDIALIQPGQRRLVFAATDGAITQETLELNLEDSAIAQFEIGSTTQEAFLGINVDFAGFGELNRNQTNFGNYLNRVQTAGSSAELAPLVEGLFGLSEPSQLAAPFDSLSPEIYGNIQSNMQLTSQQLLDDLFSCKATDAGQRFIAAGQCVWVDTSYQSYGGDRTREHFGFDSSITANAAGMQVDLGNDLFLGLAASNSRYRTSSLAASKLEGSSSQAGISLNQGIGKTQVGLALMAGTGDFDAERNGIFPFNAQAESEQDASVFGARLRVARDIPLKENWYVRPRVDLGLTRVRYQGFDETGAGALNLLVDGDSKIYGTFNPSIEIGGEFKAGDLRIRPTAQLGYTRFLNNPSSEVSARLEGAPSGVDAFTVSNQGDRNRFDAAVGFDLLFKSGLALEFGYWGQFSQDTSSHGGEIKMSIPF